MEFENVIGHQIPILIALQRDTLLTTQQPMMVVLDVTLEVVRVMEISVCEAILIINRPENLQYLTLVWWSLLHCGTEMLSP